jgi:hypothetical protein
MTCKRLRIILGLLLISIGCSAFSISRRRPVARQSRHLEDQTTVTALRMIGSGFSFQDEHQILVSVQKPLGLVLEQDQGDDTKDAMIVVAAETDPNGTGAMAGVQVGDVLVAVQNTSVEGRPLEEVLRIIGSAPNVLNLRFLRHRTRA